jgi:signal transduction histidine kinase/ActR/RegA family two-component response regulator
MKKLFNRFFSPQLSFRLTLFNIISTVGLIGGLISFGVSLANGLPAIQDAVVFCSILMLAYCLYLANFKDRLKAASIIIISLITMVLLPIMFITGGGVYGGMPSWFVIGIVFTFLLIDGRLCLILVAIQTLLYIGCFTVAYYHPEWITQFPSRSGVFIDAAQSMFIAAFTLGLIMRFQSMAYDKAMKKLIDQNRQLEAATDAANAANKAKTEFLSHMSHDIRTPINGIVGMLDIAERNPSDAARQADCLKKIRVSSMHLLSLINDILDISRLESGKVEFAAETFDLKTLVDDCCTIIRENARMKKLSFDLDVSGIVHSCLSGSPLHVRQVIINILGNAIKYNREGGSISFAVRELSFANETASVEFRIADTGIGISEEFMKHLFEPFTQETGGARTQFNGSGLGMSITKDLVEQMGGTISAESVQGKGSIFTVVLPFKTGDPAILQIEEESGKKEDVLDGMKILLVEDNDLNREIASYILTAGGASVTEAVNGREAVGIFAESDEEEFDVILMDIMMPVMDGLEATRQIRALARKDAGQVKIIAMTANAYQEDVLKAKEAGMDGYLTKPLDSEKMVKMIAGSKRHL